MSLTQKIQDAPSSAGPLLNNFTLSAPDQVGGVYVKSPTNDYDQVVAVRDALKAALPLAEYSVAFRPVLQ